MLSRTARGGRARIVAVLWTLFSLAVAKAEDTQPPSVALKQLSLEELSQIDVTSPSKEPAPAFKTPMAIYVITNEEIRRSGVTTIPEALRLAPGVEVARIDGSKWSIGIRGFGTRLSRSVLVLIDGRTVYTTFFAGTYWEVQDTVLDDIERIEVIRGPGGTIWGPNAVNGVINIITKSTKDTPGTLATVRAGNQEQGSFDFRYGGSAGASTTYRVYGKGFSRGPEYHPDQQNFDDWRGAQTGFRVDSTKGDRDAITIQGDAYKQEDGERVTATSYTPPYSRDIDANAHLSGGNVLARWKRTLNEGSDFQVQAYYDRTNRYEPNFAENRDTFDVDYLQRLKIAGRQQFLWGAGARWSAGRATQVVSGLTFDPLDRTDHLFTGFFQDDIDLVKGRVQLSLGTKMLNTNFSGFQLEPSARLMWTPTETRAFWVAYTHALRTPSRAEEDFFLSGFIATTPDGTPFFARFNANNNFASEQLNGYDFGYRELLGKKTYLDISGFYNHYHDLFSQDITGSPFVETNPAPTHILLPAQFGNGLLGLTTGVEIAPEWRPTGYWRLRGSYSFLHMDLQRAPGSQDVGSAPGIMGSSPQHQVGIHSFFDLSKTMQLDLLYSYVSALTSQNVPAYSTGDARFSWRLRGGVEIAVVGQNLLSPQHPEYQGDPGPLVGIRRSGYLKLTWVR